MVSFGSVAQVPHPSCSSSTMSEGSTVSWAAVYPMAQSCHTFEIQYVRSSKKITGVDCANILVTSAFQVYHTDVRVKNGAARNLQEAETERREFIRRFSGNIRQARMYISKVFGEHPLGRPRVAQTCGWSHCHTDRSSNSLQNVGGQPWVGRLRTGYQGNIYSKMTSYNIYKYLSRRRKFGRLILRFERTTLSQLQRTSTATLQNIKQPGGSLEIRMAQLVSLLQSMGQEHPFAELSLTW